MNNAEHSEAAASVSVYDMLSAREQRAERQKALLSEYHSPLICFTMNIPGPVKSGEEIHAAFSEGIRRIRRALASGTENDAETSFHILHEEYSEAKSGYEYYVAVSGSAAALKRICTGIEEADRLGRLFDIDILDRDGRKESRKTLGLPPRRCLLCGRDARICGRSRAHELPALQQEVLKIIEDELHFF